MSVGNRLNSISDNEKFILVDDVFNFEKIISDNKALFKTKSNTKSV